MLPSTQEHSGVGWQTCSPPASVTSFQHNSSLHGSVPGESTTDLDEFVIQPRIAFVRFVEAAHASDQGGAAIKQGAVLLLLVPTLLYCLASRRTVSAMLLLQNKS